MISTPKFLIFFNVIFLASLSSSDMYYPENALEGGLYYWLGCN